MNQEKHLLTRSYNFRMFYFAHVNTADDLAMKDAGYTPEIKVVWHHENSTEITHDDARPHLELGQTPPPF